MCFNVVVINATTVTGTAKFANGRGGTPVANSLLAVTGLLPYDASRPVSDATAAEAM
jgi:hypothetical protein